MCLYVRFHGRGGILVHCTYFFLQIIRGVALGLALIMYGQEEGAETLIEDMTRDQDPILRCTAKILPSMPQVAPHVTCSQGSYRGKLWCAGTAACL